MEKSLLEHLYLEEKLTESEIGEKVGMSQRQISYYRKKYGIPTIKKSDRYQIEPLTVLQKDLVLGSLLGDGTLNKQSNCDTAYFSITHGEKQLEYLSWKANLLKNYQTGVLKKSVKDKKYVSYRFSTKTSSEFYPFYELFYGTGRRVFPKNLHELINPFILAIWYLDDGSLQKNSPRISFGLCQESLDNATKALLALGLKPSFHADKRRQTDLHVGGEFRFPGQAEYFYNLIKDHVPSCMEYKIPIPSERKILDLNARKLTHEEATLLQHQGRTVSEIAQEFSVSENTVRRRLEGNVKRLNYKFSYNENEASVALSHFEVSQYQILTEGEKKEWVNKIYEVLSKTSFPFPQLSEDYISEIEKFKLLTPFLSEEKEISPRSYQGNLLCSPFFPNRYKAISSSVNRSAYDMWHSEKHLRKAIKYQLEHGDPIVPQRVLKALVMMARTPSVFRPVVAKYLYEKYAPKGSWVYDPCMGFGGRLLGAYAAGVRYMGTDVEKVTVEGNRQLAELLGYEDIDLHLCKAEEFVSPRKISFAFTSPPYFSAEKYSQNENQSYNRFENDFDLWAEGFLKPMVEKVYGMLEDEGFFALNIADVKRKKVVYPLESLSCEIGKEVGFSFVEMLKMPISNLNRTRKFEPIFIFQKK